MYTANLLFTRCSKRQKQNPRLFSGTFHVTKWNVVVCPRETGRVSGWMGANFSYTPDSSKAWMSSESPVTRKRRIIEKIESSKVDGIVCTTILKKRKKKWRRGRKKNTCRKEVARRRRRIDEHVRVLAYTIHTVDSGATVCGRSDPRHKTRWIQSFILFHSILLRGDNRRGNMESSCYATALAGWREQRMYIYM